MTKFIVDPETNFKKSTNAEVQKLFDDIKSLDNLQVILTAIQEPVCLTSTIDGNIQINHPYDY